MRRTTNGILIGLVGLMGTGLWASLAPTSAPAQEQYARGRIAPATLFAPADDPPKADDPPADPPADPLSPYQRGRVAPPNLPALRAAAAERTEGIRRATA